MKEEANRTFAFPFGRLSVHRVPLPLPESGGQKGKALMALHINLPSLITTAGKAAALLRSSVIMLIQLNVEIEEEKKQKNAGGGLFVCQSQGIKNETMLVHAASFAYQIETLHFYQLLF